MVDCNGVGYDVIVSAYTLAGLPADGERVTLRVFTHATENRIALFGFLEPLERALFDLMITVKNVGPSTAIAILSGSSPSDMARLIAAEDVAGLTRIKKVSARRRPSYSSSSSTKKCAVELVLAWDASGALRLAAIPIGASAQRPQADR